MGAIGSIATNYSQESSLVLLELFHELAAFGREVHQLFQLDRKGVDEIEIWCACAWLA